MADERSRGLGHPLPTSAALRAGEGPLNLDRRSASRQSVLDASYLHIEAPRRSPPPPPSAHRRRSSPSAPPPSPHPAPPTAGPHSWTLPVRPPPGGRRSLRPRRFRRSAPNPPLPLRRTPPEPPSAPTRPPRARARSPWPRRPGPASPRGSPPPE